LVLLQRFYHEGLAQASYLVGCQRTGTAVVVDGNRDIAQYVAAANGHGLRITYVTETHIHADYLSGSRELAAATGATLLLSGEGGPDWQYGFAAASNATLLRDGDHFMLGDVRFDVVHTPGHTPEHLIFIVTDTAASERPLGAFTGDFIFVGDVGRPDLLERAAGLEGTMRAGAKLLFESLRRFTEHYPDYLQLWPGHGAGSACGKSLGAVPQTTLGYEKIVNWAFQIDDEAHFADLVLEGQPDPPVYFATMKRLNREGPPPRPQLRVRRRDAGEVIAALSRGDVVLDIRRASEVAKGFVPGSINIPFARSFVGYAGWLVPYDRDIYLLHDAAEDTVIYEATAELGMIGLDRVCGWFGSDALAYWGETGRALATVPRVTPMEVAAELEAGGVTVVDVRREDEWNSGRIAGARLAPLGRLAEFVANVPRDERIVVVCQSGNRSAIAASVLAAHGFHSYANMPGGVAEWERAGLPLERDTAALTPS
jgi:hydroxyacylglutathione hydrolase